MKPTLPTDAGEAGRHAPAAAVPPGPLDMFRPAQETGTAVAATAAFAANRALASEISLMHILAGLVKQNARLWATANAANHGGVEEPLVGLMANVCEQAADSMVAVANQLGRSFGRIAFAFPPVLPGSGWPGARHGAS